MEKRIEENTRKELRAAQEKENLTNKFRTKRAEVESALELCATKKKKREF